MKYLVLTMMLVVLSSWTVKAEELKRVDATGYLAKAGAKTASGDKIREGIASSNKYFGMTAIVYEDDNGEIGDFIGIYELLDKGGTEGLKNGSVIDIYCEDDTALRELINRTYENSNGKVWVQIVDAKG